MTLVNARWRCGFKYNSVRMFYGNWIIGWYFGRFWCEIHRDWVLSLSIRVEEIHLRHFEMINRDKHWISFHDFQFEWKNCVASKPTIAPRTIAIWIYAAQHRLSSVVFSQTSTMRLRVFYQQSFDRSIYIIICLFVSGFMYEKSLEW